MKIVQGSANRLCDEFANPKDWLRDPVEMSKKRMQHRKYARDSEPLYNDHRWEQIPSRTRESARSPQDRDDDPERGFNHSPIEIKLKNVSVVTVGGGGELRV